MSSYRFIAAVVLFASPACTDTDSATNLHPSGPPKIEQVRMRETFLDASGTPGQRVVFGFGTHPQATSDEEHQVTSALAAGDHTLIRFRIIMDQLILGNNLEEIACRAPVGPDGAFDRVPIGATPDDIALCTTAKDVLPQSCKGDHAVCLCQLDGGCIVGSDPIAKGQPVGVLDDNQDGAADLDRFIKGSVGLKCGAIDVAVNVNASYWNPSGFQQVPAMGGFDALGPAIVLIPDIAPGTMLGGMPEAALPTNTTCQIVFDKSVVNVRGESVCAPAGGDPNVDCSPGDTSAVSFKTEPMDVSNDGIAIASTDAFFLAVNAAVDAATTSAITITNGATAVTGFTIQVSGTVTGSQLKVIPTTAWPANATLTVTIPSGFHDAYGVSAPMPISIPITTGP